MDPKQLTQSIQAYDNAITKLEADLETLKQRRRSLEIERDALFAPRRAETARTLLMAKSDVKVPCRLCGALTFSRTRTNTGYIVAECRPECPPPRRDGATKAPKATSEAAAAMLAALGLS